jgi:hypothetical protein
MGEIKERRPLRRTAVEHLKRARKKYVEIDERPNYAFKHQCVVAGVPPPVCRSPRQLHRATRFDLQLAAIHFSAQRARHDSALLVLVEVDMQRRTVPPRRKRALHFQAHHAGVDDPAHPQPFSRMPIREGVPSLGVVAEMGVRGNHFAVLLAFG